MKCDICQEEKENLFKICIEHQEILNNDVQKEADHKNHQLVYICMSCGQDWGHLKKIMTVLMCSMIDCQERYYKGVVVKEVR